MINRKAQERNLLRLVVNDGFQFTDTFFPYTSGEVGPYYIQAGVILKRGTHFHLACRDMSDLIECEAKRELHDKGMGVVSGGESRDWIFSLPIAEGLGVPHAMIYKNGKIVGADMGGRKVVHVADLNNEGSSPRSMWVPAIKKAGGEIKHIFFYVDRMEDGVQVMKDLGLESHAVVPLDAVAWDSLKKKNLMQPEIYQTLRTRMEDRDEWARKMLKSEKGFAELERLHKKEPAKVNKILNCAKYADIAPELKERLRLE